MVLTKLKTSLAVLWETQRSLCAIWIAVVIYTVFFTTISFLRYDAFSYSDFDFAIFVHENWKILHGSGEISIFNNIPIWGNGLELISALTAPIYFIFGFNPKIFLFLQSFGLGVSAVPIYLIARYKLPNHFALCLALGYLLNPSVWFTNLYEYNPLTYTTLTLLLSFYFLQRERFGMFMLFVFFTIINRADLGIVTFMFGVYAFFERKPWKWVIWPSMISFLWVTVGLLVIIPKFKGELTYASSYHQFGNSFDQIILNMLMHPDILWKSLSTPEDMKYYFQIFYPVFFMPLLGLKQFLICILSMVQHLASNRPQEHTIFFHYTSTITPFVYISAAYGMARLVVKGKIAFMICVLPIVLSISANFLYGPIFHRGEFVSEPIADHEDIYKRKMLSEIPANEPVTSSFEFSPMLAGRNKYYSFHYIYGGYFSNYVPYKTPADIEYALVNFQDPRMLGFRLSDSDKKVQAFINDGNFGLLDKINTIALFKKNHPSKDKLFEVVEHEQPLEGGIAEVKNGARLWKVDSQLIQKRGQNVLSLTFHWGTLSQLKEDFWSTVALVNSQSQQVYAQTRMNFYGFYPAARWAQGQEILDHYDMLLPDNLKPGKYKVYMAFLSTSTNRYMYVNKIDGNALVENPQGNIIIAEFNIPEKR